MGGTTDTRARAASEDLVLRQAAQAEPVPWPAGLPRQHLVNLGPLVSKGTSCW
jgi:hypothetical protein